MPLSIETLALSRKYSKKVATQSMLEAVSQSKLYTDEVVSHINSFQLKIVETLPTENIDPHTMYLVPRSTAEEINSYYEYFYIQNKWELVGTTEVDLSGYYTKEEVNDLIDGVRYTLPIASKTTLGGVKIDDETIVINETGTISVKTEFVNDKIDDKVGQIDDGEINSLFTK